MKKTSIITRKELFKLIGASLVGMAIITWFNYAADLYVFRSSAESVVKNLTYHLPKIIDGNAFSNPLLPENEVLFLRFFEDATISGRIDGINIFDSSCELVWSNALEKITANSSQCLSEMPELQKRRSVSKLLFMEENSVRISGIGPSLVVHAPFSLVDGETGILEVYFAATDINRLWVSLRFIKMGFAGIIILSVIISFYFIFKKRSSEISAELEAYAKIVAEAPMGIYTINKRGVIETFNPKMIELAGAKIAADVIGLNVFKLPSYKEVGLDHYFKGGLAGKPFDIETHYISYTGHKRSYRHYLGTPILSEEGNVEKLLLMVEDITLRKELELKLSEEKTRLLASIDSLLLGFIVIDAENKIIAVNPAFKKLSRVGDDSTFVEVADYWRPAVDLQSQITKVAATKEVAELPIIKHDGRFFRIIIAPVIPEINEVSVTNYTIGSVIVVEDVTEKELLEESKKDFVAITSHEMRTPLSIIRGAAERLLKICSRINAPEEAHTMATYIDSSSIRLLDIVNKLLDVAALEGKSVQFLKDIFNANETISEVVSELGPKAKNKGLRLDTDFSEKTLRVIADQDKTREIISNLLANAIQYTESGGIKISTKQSGKFIKISFSDTGIGIPSEMKELIFQKFRSVHGRFMKSREYGSGMGLYISRTMAESMGGELLLEKSTLGEGSTFTLLLPAETD